MVRGAAFSLSLHSSELLDAAFWTFHGGRYLCDACSSSGLVHRTGFSSAHTFMDTDTTLCLLRRAAVGIDDQ